ncbi:hypothetical protein HanPI659440_Chr08g0293251 [Helianthus annuus]|nr:hypothetical protein HanPI659440_Chr08g0293251 [Helianthus annuus]
MALAGDKHVESSSGDLILAGRSNGPISSAVSTPSHKTVISEPLNIQQRFTSNLYCFILSIKTAYLVLLENLITCNCYSAPRETQPHTPSYYTQSNFTLNGFI